MDVVLLSRLQFALTSVFHFFFVPLTLGLVLFVAVLETLYFVTKKEEYLKMTKFWGKLFVINFAVGIVTGLVQEFQFGMNWSEYSRFVGDIFGTPLAIEALLAFFLESTFIGVWLFGWKRLSKGVHLLSIWLVAISSNLSALWILIAHSFMNHPVGYKIVEQANGKMRAEMQDFFALITNEQVWNQFPHVIFGAMCTGAFFILGISAYHLLKKGKDYRLFKKSFQYAAIYAAVASLLVAVVGHDQAQFTTENQPMKMAAGEALWESADPAAFSLFTIGDPDELKDVWSIRIPGFLSFLAYNEFEGEVKGIRNMQAEYQEKYADKYGPDANYVPPLPWSYWSFRFMLGAGTIMIILGIIALVLTLRDKISRADWFLKLLIPSIALPFIAHSAGWMFTEIGRMPWMVQGLLRVEEGISPNLTLTSVIISITVFTLLYLFLTATNFYLLRKTAIKGIEGIEEEE